MVAEWICTKPLYYCFKTVLNWFILKTLCLYTNSIAQYVFTF